MAKERAYAHFLCDAQGAQCSVLEQSSTDSPACPVDMHSESSQHYDWNRLGHVAANASRRTFTRHRACAQTVIADYDIGVAHDEGAGGAFQLVLTRPLLEPIFQGRLSAAKTIKLMLVGERQGSEQRQADLFIPRGSRGEQLGDTLVLAQRLVEQFQKTLELPLIQNKSCLIDQYFLGFFASRLQHELRAALTLRFCRSIDQIPLRLARAQVNGKFSCCRGYGHERQLLIEVAGIINRLYIRCQYKMEEESTEASIESDGRYFVRSLVVGDY
jgi:hypothetical protein